MFMEKQMNEAINKLWLQLQKFINQKIFTNHHIFLDLKQLNRC